MKDKIPENIQKYPVDFSVIVDKPYFVRNISWSNQSRYSILSRIVIPTDILTNPLVKKPFETTVFYRTKLCLLLQTSGTPLHQGTILAAALPIGFNDNMSFSTFTRDSDKLASLMCAPHVFLSANDSNSACLEVPFYANTSVLRTDVAGNTVNSFTENYAEVLLMVLNPLSAPLSGSTTMSISVHAMFKESEFYVPHVDPSYSSFKAESKIVSQAIDSIASVAEETTHDIIDEARKGVKEYIGLDNANVPFISQRILSTGGNFFNCVDSATFYEKLDPFFQYDRVMKDFCFDTKLDEMDMKYICSKPAYLGTFRVTSTDSVGTVLWSRPITPFQNNYMNESQTNHILTHPLEKFAYLSRYWSGGLKVHIQSNMSNFHFCKLILARNYSPVQPQLNAFPNFNDIQNLMTSTLEFSAGGQVQTIDLPYMNTFPYVNTTVDWIVNALQHGMYYIYLAQPLVFSGSVATSVEFNVFISAAEDFQLYGYSTNNLSNYSNNPAALFKAEAAVAPMAVSDQSVITLNSANESNTYDDTILRPITSVRDLFRRPVPSFSTNRGTINSNTAAFYTFEVSRLIKLIQDSTTVFKNSLDILFSMFYGFKGGVRLRLSMTGANIVNYVYYYPPAMSIDFTNVDIIRAVEGLSLGGAGVADAANNYVTNLHDPIVTTPVVNAERPQTVSKLIPESVRIANGTQVTFWDFLIPNYNPARFLGTMNRFRPGNPTTLNEYCSSLGYIAVAFEPSTSSAPLFTLYAGISDEARVGFQVISTPCQIFGTVSTFGSNSYHFTRTTDVNQIGGSVPPIPYSAQSTACPNCYFTRA